MKQGAFGNVVKVCAACAWASSRVLIHDDLGGFARVCGTCTFDAFTRGNP